MRKTILAPACLAALASALLLTLFSINLLSQGRSAPLAAKPDPYGPVFQSLREIGLSGEKAYEILREILSVGPRLTGSRQADEAVAVCLDLMERFELENVHSEPVEVERWVRGEVAEAEVLPPAVASPLPLAIAALGGSVGTSPTGIEGELVEVRSLQELASHGRSLAGKIVLFNRPMDRTNPDPFAAYGAAADQRVSGPSAAARYGAAAVLVRSLTFRLDGHPHTGMLRYSEGTPPIPAAAVSTRDAELLSDLIKTAGKVKVRIRLDCRGQGRVVSANAIGEIRGSERPHEIVLLGGHLDSWDLGTGAHDDGAGCAAALEAVRLIKALGARPRRTVRAVMFMDEEFGGTGGRAYVRDPRRKGERHIVAAESDRGGFLPLGLAVGGQDPRPRERLLALERWLRPLGVLFIVPGGGGVDVAPLVEEGALPASVLLNAQTYFDVHHSALDVLESVHPRELEIQAVILASLAYIFAEEGVPR